MIAKEDCKVGWFLTPKKRSKHFSHIVDILTNKPLCNCFVDAGALFKWKSSKIEDATCLNCKNVWLANLKKQWKKY